MRKSWYRFRTAVLSAINFSGYLLAAHTHVLAMACPDWTGDLRSMLPERPLTDKERDAGDYSKAVRWRARYTASKARGWKGDALSEPSGMLTPEVLEEGVSVRTEEIWVNIQNPFF